MRAIRLALMVATLVSCTRADREPGATPAVRTDSAGVAIVRSTGTDRELPWRFTRRLVLGGDDSGPASFHRVRGVDTDARGNLYVLDAGSHRVVVFDSTGAVVREMGRKGGGPGEMQWPLQLTVMTDGGVAVYDLGRRGLVVFDSAGVPRDAGVRTPVEMSSTDVVRHAGDGWYLSRLDQSNDESVIRTTLVHHAGAGEVELVRMEKPRPRMISFPNCPIQVSMGPIFEPEPAWDARGGRVVTARGAEYAVDVYENDRLSASYRRDVPSRTATPELAARHVSDGMTANWPGGRCVIGAADVVQARGVAPVIQAISEVRLAPGGELFVARDGVQGEPTLIDVLAPNGDYLGTLPAGSPMPKAFLPDGDLVTIETDEETDVQRVVTYRVERGAVGKP